ncbi:MAG: phosphoribosylaminoimidazolesuccinocarboxamide synthase [Chloroflexota bacterium]
MTAVETVIGSKITEGKTKVLYAATDRQDAGRPGAGGDLAYMVHKDQITAGDGERRDMIPGKGALSCRTTSQVFRYLAGQGIPTHFVEMIDDRTMLVRRAHMIPIEWVARRVAAGSYVKRTGVIEGTRFDEPILELFLKDDARHDPQISIEEAAETGLCTMPEVQLALDITLRVFLALEEAWKLQDIQLVDLKIEFGRSSERLLVADVVDNDSWRLWPGGKRAEQLDKQVYRDLQTRDSDALDGVRNRYEEVARRVEAFGCGD